MSQFAIAARRGRSFGRSKGALYRETLQATGFHVGRIVIAQQDLRRCLHPLYRATPAVSFRRPSGCVFGGMAESIGPMWSKAKAKNQTLGTRLDRLPPVSPAPRKKNVPGGSRSSHRPR